MKRAFFILSIVISLEVNAQPAKGTPGGSPVPIDGISLLVVAGAVLGGKLAYDQQKTS